ncbi:hypothetical protein HPP92_004772 [Vanilla planifolia]|uniref:C3H1-type domain-containing protein n=1 Tax=Vanilla planifolia TaxID=51239 RepID=A0A835RHH4_VANPL|nr:hypothetical protein HPP92_004772 [Vanilla planifolia]
MEGIMNFGHCKMEKDGHHQEAISPKLVVSGDAEVSAASRTCDDLPDFNSPHGQAERKQQMFSCTSTEHFEVLGVDVSSQSCVKSLQSLSASEISNSILKQDFPDEVNFEENNELDFSGCNLLPQSCCDGAFQDNLVIDASSDRMEHSLALEHRKMEAPCKHCKNANYQPKLSESENFNNCVFCGEEDQKHVGKEETLVLSLVSLGSDTDDQLGKSTRHNQLMSNKTQDLMSQDLKKKVTHTKLVDENFYLKTSPNQGMVPRILPNSKIFTGLVKNTGRTSQIGRHRTWVRTNKPSLILDANLQQPGRNLTKQVPETQGKVQNSSYIRKGNSLIRKQDEPSPMLLPPIDASGIIFKSNTERSSVCESRLECMENAASSYSFVERPKTPPLPHSKVTDSSMNANNSFPLPKSVDGRPELISDQCKQHDSQYKDLHSCNLESQEVKGHASIKTNNPKRITYIKRKMNQLIVAPELEIDESSKFSTKTSQIIVPHPEERSKATPVSSSYVYYRRKRNQLVLNASSSDNQQAGVPIGNSNSVDHSKQNNSVNSRIVFQKEKKAGKSSLVGMLGGFRRSHKIIGTLHRQGVLPFILPWKRLAKRKSFLKTTEPLSRRSSSLSLISLKWSKSIEKRSKKASEEATLAVAEVERKKRERKRRKGSCGNGKNKVVLPCGSTSNCVLKQDDNPSSLPSQQSGNKNQMPFVPSRLSAGNDEYIRIGTGNQLVRDTNNIKRIIASEKIRWSLHTARLRLARKRQYCLFFTRFGKCKNFGGKCPFLHDTSKVAICTKFLKGQCSDNNCKLTHKVIPERMQDCSYFLKGLCTIENCPYRHVKVNANALLCDGFLRGHCDDGDECHKKHSYTCPLFEATGKCPQGNVCKLHHPKAHSKSRKRKRAKLQSSCQGRYFCSSIDKTVEPLRVVSGEVLKGVDDIFLSDGRFTEYISLDVYSDTGCIENNSYLEFDSKYCDSKSSDIDELLKPTDLQQSDSFGRALEISERVWIFLKQVVRVHLKRFPSKAEIDGEPSIYAKCAKEDCLKQKAK